MADEGRVSQEAAEVIGGAPPRRVSQVAVEVLTRSTANRGGVSQVAVEVLVLTDWETPGSEFYAVLV